MRKMYSKQKGKGYIHVHYDRIFIQTWRWIAKKFILTHKSSVQEYQWSHENVCTLVQDCGRKPCYNGEKKRISSKGLLPSQEENTSFNGSLNITNLLPTNINTIEAQNQIFKQHKIVNFNRSCIHLLCYILKSTRRLTIYVHLWSMR